MNDEEIKKGNVLIAEFMQYNDIDCHECKHSGVCNYLQCGLSTQEKIEQFKFHSSWDWLMLVVEKIEQSSINIIGRYEDVIINGCSCLIHLIDDDIVTIGTTKKEAVFFGVVEYIKWYNQNKIDINVTF